MFTGQDYSQMTLDELVSEDEKLESQKYVIMLSVGFIVGIAIWTAAHKNSFFLTVVLLVLAVSTGSSYSKKRKNVREEISRRNSVR